MAKPGPDPIGKEDCIRALEAAKKELGHSPTIREFRSLDIEPNASTIKRRFGGWNNAKEHIGIETNVYSYNANRDFFEKIDSPIKAYWIGFFWADGSISVQNTFKISSADIDHLEKIKRDMDAKHPIYTHGKVPCFVIKSEKITNDLKNHGASIRKAHDSTIPDLPKWANKHFFRGIFDGDGHVRKTTTPVVGISGNRKRMKLLNKIAPVDGTVHDGHGTERLGFWGDNAIEIIKWMYPDGKNTEPTLDRKIKTALSLVEDR